MYEVYDIEQCEVVYEGTYEECINYNEIYYVIRPKGDTNLDLSREQLDWIQRNLK